MSVGDGAKVNKPQDICPICGEERTPNCFKVDKVRCPNEGKACKSKNGDGKRAGCQGYKQGSVGKSGCLSDNLLANAPKVPGGFPTNRLETSDFDQVDKEEGTSRASNVIKKDFDALFGKKSTPGGVTFDAEKITDPSTLDAFKKAAKANNLELKKSGNGYRQFHPLYYGYGGSMEAHHLIGIAAMEDSEEWADLCEVVGYNLDCRWNGVFLPSQLEVACTLEIPLHSGPHGSGFGGINKKGTHLSYSDRIEDEVDDILKKIRRYVHCNKPDEMKGIVTDLNMLSKKAFHKIKDFIWTLTSDGFDYMPHSKIGCGDCSSLGDKTNSLKGQVEKHKGNMEKIAIKDLETNRQEILDEFKKVMEDTHDSSIKGCKCQRKHQAAIERINLFYPGYDKDKTKYQLKYGE